MTLLNRSDIDGRVYTSTSDDWPEVAKLVTLIGDPVGGRLRSDKSNTTPTIEWTNAHLTFMIPEHRLVDPPGRKLNVPFAVLDAMEMVTGGDGSASAGWNRFMEQFRAPDGSVPGSYGRRIFIEPDDGRGLSVNQYARAFQELKANPDSRRAVVVVNNPLYENFNGNNVACTLSLQYLIRQGSLMSITTMRSNDVLKGFCYDTFAFQFMQELLAAALSLTPGPYFHNAGSLHAYDTDVKAISDGYGDKTPYDDAKAVSIHKGLDLELALEVISMIREVPKMPVGDYGLKVMEAAFNCDEYVGNCAAIVGFETYRRNGLVNLAKDSRAMLTNEFVGYADRAKLQ